MIHFVRYMAFGSEMSLAILRTRKGFDYSHIIGSEAVTRDPKVKKQDGKDEKIKGAIATIYKDHQGNALDTNMVAGIQMFLVRVFRIILNY